jgi:hypothetical protein
MLLSLSGSALYGVTISALSGFWVFVGSYMPSQLSFSVPSLHSLTLVRTAESFLLDSILKHTNLKIATSIVQHFGYAWERSGYKPFSSSLSNTYNYFSRLVNHFIWYVESLSSQVRIGSSTLYSPQVWAPALVYESILFGLTVVKAYQHRRSLRLPVTRTLYRDGKCNTPDSSSVDQSFS